MSHPILGHDYTEELTEAERELMEMAAKLSVAVDNLRKAADRAIESTLQVQKIIKNLK
jgi:hypothetical protein